MTAPDGLSLAVDLGVRSHYAVRRRVGLHHLELHAPHAATDQEGVILQFRVTTYKPQWHPSRSGLLLVARPKVQIWQVSNVAHARVCASALAAAEVGSSTDRVLGSQIG